MNIYVGNLSFETSEDELRAVFEEFGEVSRVTILKDKFSGKSRGFGFVEMPSDDNARAAIEGANGKQVGGRALKVNESQPKTDQGDRGPRRGGGRRE
jgi:RNA recognition motif-containing protein